MKAHNACTVLKSLAKDRSRPYTPVTEQSHHTLFQVACNLQKEKLATGIFQAKQTSAFPRGVVRTRDKFTTIDSHN